MRLLLIALRLPRSIRFPVAWAHHRSPHICVAQAGHPGTPIIAARLTQGNKRATSRRDAFVDSLLAVTDVCATRHPRSPPARTCAPAVLPGNVLHGDRAVDGHPIHQPPLG